MMDPVAGTANPAQPLKKVANPPLIIFDQLFVLSPIDSSSLVIAAFVSAIV